jgi:hypothetical protein
VKKYHLQGYKHTYNGAGNNRASDRGRERVVHVKISWRSGKWSQVTPPVAIMSVLRSSKKVFILNGISLRTATVCGFIHFSTKGMSYCPAQQLVSYTPVVVIDLFCCHKAFLE